MPTKDQLKKFVKMRNASPHQANLQFYFDAEACGINPNIFEAPTVIAAGYLWALDCGTLVERAGRLDRLAFFPKGITIDHETGEPVARA